MRSERLVTTGVLIIGFNRPELLAGAIANLRDHGQDRLFIAVDGPRETHLDDSAKVQACRKVALAAAAGGPVETLFQDENLGCRGGVSAAIDWLFTHVDRGVIIEDDVRIGPAFLPYTDELLERHADSPDVGMVSGFTPLDSAQGTEDPASYRFSWYGSCWGWATWADRWQEWPGSGHVRWPEDAIVSGLTAAHARFLHRMLKGGLVDSWNWSWELTRLEQGWLTCMPHRRLSTNIGFGGDSTHTSFDGAPLPIDPSLWADTRWTHPERIALDPAHQDQLIRGLDRLHRPLSRILPRRLRWRVIETVRAAQRHRTRR